MAILANIFIDQGTDFTITVDVADSVGEALNMTGYTAAGQIRKTYSSSTRVVEGQAIVTPGVTR